MKLKKKNLEVKAKKLILKEISVKFLIYKSKRCNIFHLTNGLKRIKSNYMYFKEIKVGIVPFNEEAKAPSCPNYLGLDLPSSYPLQVMQIHLLKLYSRPSNNVIPNVRI